MSRAAFYEALVHDSILNGLGINEDTVFHNWSSEERPSNENAFAILRWGEEGGPIWGSEVDRGPRDVTVWVHFPSELTNDFDEVTKVLNRMDVVLADLRDVSGNDGYTLSFVKVGGRSPDLLDEGFNTITRNANYAVYSVLS